MSTIEPRYCTICVDSGGCTEACGDKLSPRQIVARKLAVAYENHSRIEVRNMLPPMPGDEPVPVFSTWAEVVAYHHAKNVGISPGYLGRFERTVMDLCKIVQGLSALIEDETAPPADKPLIDRLKAAVEGECDGLAITDEQAKAVLSYVLGGDDLSSLLIAAQEESSRLREALRRLGSTEAFHVASGSIPKEVEMRIEFALKALGDAA